MPVHPGPAARLCGDKIRTRFGACPLSSLARQIFQHYGDEIEHHLDDLLTEQMVKREVDRVVYLKDLNDDELLQQTLGSDWTLRLTSPPLAPPSPLQILQPHEVAYKAALKLLPIDIANRVVSVRRVRASARIGEFQRLKQSLSGNVVEKEPLFHGTPERWRSTAIALNGFDMGIKLNGRSQGDGVYTSSDVSRAGAYTATSGSLIHLRGLVTSNSTNPGQNTIVQGTEHVFPDSKALLPLTIADYAAEDGRDQLESQRQSAQQEHKRMLERRQDMVKSMANMEEEFKCTTAKRLKQALVVYNDRLCMLSTELTSAYSSVEGAKNDMSAALRKLSARRQFFQERYNFRQGLPIYEWVKEDEFFQVHILQRRAQRASSTLNLLAKCICAVEQQIPSIISPLQAAQ